MRYVLALSRSAFVIRHWFEINLDDASMEHGARIELRELPVQPHRGTESAAQLVTLDRPLWRADLFDRLADAPGTFGAAHYHPEFDGNEPCGRVWDAGLTADPGAGSAARSRAWAPPPATAPGQSMPRTLPRSAAWPARWWLRPGSSRQAGARRRRIATS
jgi:hypothetical protein